MKFAVIDTETTGLYTSDRVVEIAIVMLDEGGQVLDEWDTLLHPGRDVGPVDIHGVSATMVSAAPTFEDVRWAIAERLHGAVLVAHNLTFDQRMLDSEFDRSEGGWEPGSGVCTLQNVGGKLANACAQLGITIEHEHRALSDARATAQLFAQTVLRSDLHVRSAQVDPSQKKSPRTVRREAFPDRPQGITPQESIARWTTGIDHRRYPRDELGYIDLLDRALDDLWISADEMVELGTLAQLAGIAPSRLPELHELYVGDLYAAAIRDHVINDDEFRQLDAVSQVLGFNLSELYPDFEQYRPAAVQVAQTPQGARVAFTGTAIDPRTGQKLDRSELGAICRSRGYEPQDALKKSSTDLLVASDPNSNSGKAKKARQWGIPVISVEEFVLEMS